MEFFKEYPFVIGALSGSLAAYLIGLVVSHLRREKRWLGYAIDSRNIVRSEHSDLTIQYKGQVIKRLDSHTVSLKNVGNRALVNLPVRIVITPPARIVGEPEVIAPDGATFALTRPAETELSVTCDLLNPDENAEVGITIADSSTGEITLIARVEGLTLIRLGGRSISTQDLVELFGELPMVGGFVRPYLKFISKLRPQ